MRSEHNCENGAEYIDRYDGEIQRAGGGHDVHYILRDDSIKLATLYTLAPEPWPVYSMITGVELEVANTVFTGGC